MRRLGLIGLGLVTLGWLGVVGALVLSDPLGRGERYAVMLVALLTVGGHLGVLVAAGAGPFSRAAPADPGWVAIQVERYRGLAVRFALWGLWVAVVTTNLAAPGRTLWPAWVLLLASGLNLGLQPGLLLAAGWAIMARGRVVRSARLPPVVA